MTLYERPLGLYADFILPHLKNSRIEVADNSFLSLPAITCILQLMDQYYNPLSTDVTMSISFECPIIDKQVVVFLYIFVIF